MGYREVRADAAPGWKRRPDLDGGGSPVFEDARGMLHQIDMLGIVPCYPLVGVSGNQVECLAHECVCRKLESVLK